MKARMGRRPNSNSKMTQGPRVNLDHPNETGCLQLFFENLAKLLGDGTRVSFHKHNKTIALDNPDVFRQL